jgi:hypothetical protein
MSSATAFITLRRPVQYLDQFRVYTVEVDGRRRGAIGPGKSFTFPVDAGRHEVALSGGRCRSNVLTVEARPEEEVRLECGHRARGWRFPFVLLYCLIFSGQHLWLRRVDQGIDTGSSSASITSPPR